MRIPGQIKEEENRSALRVPERKEGKADRPQQ